MTRRLRVGPFLSRVLPLGLAFTALACEAPTLGVRLQLPADYSGQVSVVELRVLEPPRATPFSCDDLAFSNVESDVVDLSTAQESRIAPGESADLVDVSRTAQKLLYMVASNAEGRAVLAGCADVGEVEEATVVELAAEPVAFAETAELRPASARLEDPNQEKPEIEVLVTDINGDPLASIDTRWTVVSATGKSDEGSTITGAEGRTTIRPIRPMTPGPFVIDVGVRWADPVITRGLLIPSPIDGTATTTFDATYDTLFGRVGPLGEPGLVTLMQDGDDARVLTVYFVASQGEFVSVTSAPLAGVFGQLGVSAFAFGMLEDTQGPRDRPLLISQRARLWAEVNADGTDFASRAFDPRTFIGREVRGVFAAGSCTEAGPSLMLLEFDDHTFELYDENAVAQSELFSLGGDPLNPSERFVASGCLSDETGPIHRTFVYNPSFFGLVFFTDRGPQVEDRFRVGTWTALADGLQFVRAIGASPSLALGSQISLDDLVVARGQLRPIAQDSGDAWEVRAVAVDRLDGFPQSLTGGDFDADSLLDIATFSDFSQSPDEMLFGVEMVAGAEHRGQRIAGAIALTSTGREQVFATDFDGDGTDDLLVVDGRTFAGTVSVQLYPMGPAATLPQ